MQPTTPSRPLHADLEQLIVQLLRGGEVKIEEPDVDLALEAGRLITGGDPAVPVLPCPARLALPFLRPRTCLTSLVELYMIFVISISRI